MYMIRGWDELTYETAMWEDITTLEHAKSLLKDLSLVTVHGELRYKNLKLYKEIEL